MLQSYSLSLLLFLCLTKSFVASLVSNASKVLGSCLSLYFRCICIFGIAVQENYVFIIEFVNVNHRFLVVTMICSNLFVKKE